MFDQRAAAAFVVGFLSASLIGIARLRRRVRAAIAEGEASAAEQRANELALLEHQLSEQRVERTRAEARLDALEAQLRDQRAELAERNEALSALRANEAAVQARLEEARRGFAEREALLHQQGETLREEFEQLANRVFERQGEQHQVRLAGVLAPFKEQLTEFRQRVDTVYTADTRERASLLAEVRNLQQASERINQGAADLTRALKGDVKAQGSWGELVLERVLEASGLQRDREYFLQAARRDGDDNLKRPDVLIRLPDDKDVVVDAKLSLLAYEQALTTEDDAARAAAARAHVASLRAHVKRLAEQDYDRLQDVRSLDFVLLFVPIEAAFTLAMEHDQRLFTEAFERRVVIVSPTTLMMTLRIIHNVWRYEKQSRNAQEIARRAGALYDKLRGFVEDMEGLGRQLRAADATYKSAFGKLSAGRGNLLRQAEQVRELGAPVKKPLPKYLFEVDEEGSDDAESGDQAVG